MGNLSSAGSIVSIVSRFNTSPIVILTFISSTFRWCNRRKLVQFNTPTVTYTPSLTTRAVFYLHDPSRSLSPARDLHLIATSAFTASFFPSFPHSRIDRIANPNERRRNIAACFNSLNLIDGRKERGSIFLFFFFNSSKHAALISRQNGGNNWSGKESGQLLLITACSRGKIDRFHI